MAHDRYRHRPVSFISCALDRCRSRDAPVMQARKSTLSFCWSGGLSSLELSTVGDATTLFEEALGLYRELSDDYMG